MLLESGAAPNAQKKKVGSPPKVNANPSNIQGTFSLYRPPVKHKKLQKM